MMYCVSVDEKIRQSRERIGHMSHMPGQQGYTNAALMLPDGLFFVVKVLDCQQRGHEFRSVIRF